MVTKDRIGAALAVLAAVVGLVLVFTTRDSGNDDDGPAVATAPAVPGQQAPDDDDAKPGAPGDAKPGAPDADDAKPGAPSAQPAPAQPGAPAAPAAPDNDGDDN